MKTSIIRLRDLARRTRAIVKQIKDAQLKCKKLLVAGKCNNSVPQ